MDIARAWKDAEYRSGLSDAELAQLPPNPAGAIELTDDDLGFVTGGRLNSGTRNRRWPGRPSEPKKPTPTPKSPAWRQYKPRNSVKPRR